MAQAQFLIRNRHNNTWYGRVIIPHTLRCHFNGRAELRRSLSTSNKPQAKRRSLAFWVQCQDGFDVLATSKSTKEPFSNTQQFMNWLSQTLDYVGEQRNMVNIDKMRRQLEGDGRDFRRIETEDARGGKHVIDLGDPDKEIELALALHANAADLLDKYKDNPEMLDRILRVQTTGATHAPKSEPEAESPTPFNEAVDLYYKKLETQGRNGKKLAPRTLLHYKDKLKFWQGYFGDQEIHTLTLKELGKIQSWLTNMPPNYMKKGLSLADAVEMAQSNSSPYPPISDKTRAEYLGQLKGLLEYAHNNGFINSPIANHVEIPNTLHSTTIERLPFTTEDLQKIFPGKDYGIDFGIQKTGLGKPTKFWFPLLAAFTGARLEELGQLTTEDIRTCPDTGIIYAMIDNKGAAADGTKKRTKNLNSVRPIPIHSTLIKIGFLDYVDERREDRQDNSLFKLKRDRQGRLAKGVSNWFSRVDKRKNGKFILGYIERRGIESKGKNATGERWSKSFHSFRHTVIDNLRGQKLANGEYIREPDIALVVGHEKNKLETAQYGIDRSQLELRKAVIEAITYSNISIKNISWKLQPSQIKQ
ncbi:MAG: hypothetical protein DRR42_11150 [Gammaproteobacteria bacterium]|nr:MAG: hypothetical protein DRR42_11150 [Gammaproteobacteria bacterium]